MKVIKFVFRILQPMAFACLSGLSANAQSTVAEFPTPVTTNQIDGNVPVRDMGDPRLTRYFYTFNGIPGDLNFSVESKNLDGDVDIFTASGLRPLAKINMYSGDALARASRTIYLRKPEALILRIEGRSPNDNPGTYHISLNGAFAVAVGAAASPETAESSPPEEGRTKQGVTRVSSVGARLPATDIEATANKVGNDEVRSPPIVVEAPDKIDLPVEKKTRGTASRRSRVKVSGLPSPPLNTTPPAEKDSAVGSKEKSAVASEPATPAPSAPSGPRLIIESRDGMRVERYMSTVRKITVENGQIVVVGANGKVEKHPMADVVRMAIEP